MRIVFIVDARSPIARNWITYFIEREYEVHVISTYPCAPDELQGATLTQIPIAFANFSKIKHDGTVGLDRRNSLLTPVLAGLRSGPGAKWVRTARHILAPLEISRHVDKVRNVIKRAAPDIVHAMRIPFEGMIAAKATPAEFPLLISVWGNDFTLFAQRGRIVGRHTKAAMQTADALHCDCERDLRLARDWGFALDKPAIVLPGAGGIQADMFYPQDSDGRLRETFQIPSNAPVVINPRGFRDYVRNDVFFQALPHVLQERPDAIFVCLAMQGNAIAERWVELLGIKQNVRLLPAVAREQMADLFRLSTITVSPSLHDGTPNTLLEAMACGCFPVAGNIESIREWIDDGINGLLCDPNDPIALARAIARALADTPLRQSAREHNLRLIEQRADYKKVMARSEEFYRRIVAEAVRA